MASKERCHYIGHLENEHTACVAMTGCVGSQDVQFTILSKHAPKSSTFKWTKDGNVENMKVFFFYLQKYWLMSQFYIQLVYEASLSHSGLKFKW